MIELFPLRRHGLPEGIHGQLTKQNLFLVTHDIPELPGVANSVLLMENKTHKVLWAKCLPSPNAGSSRSGPGSGSFSQTITSKDVYYIFGGDNDSSYLFGVSKLDGEIVLKFSTAYGEATVK